MPRRLLREPLLHFAVLGALLFAAAGGTNRDDDGATIIRLGPTERAGLRADFERRTGAPPSPDDERAIVARFVEDEILYREALALGLERGDVIVRRRLLQKMEFLIDARADVEEPSRDDLRAVLDARADDYRLPERLDFEHVFVSRDRHGRATPHVAAAIAAALRAGADPSTQGDPFVRGRVLRGQSRDEVARAFGPGFADALAPLAPGDWSGPIESSYGLHLVRVAARSPARLPDVAEVEGALRQDWLDERRAAVRQAVLAELRDRYEVRVSGRDDS